MNSLKSDSKKANKNTLGSLFSQRIQIDKIPVKVKLPSVNKALGLNWEQREIFTPFFGDAGRNEGNLRENREMQEQGRRNSRSLFFDHLKVKKMPDLSFGGVEKKARNGVRNL